MSADSLLPIAPARVKALCVPIGQIKATRFASFLERLQGEHVVHLRDVGPDKRPNRSTNAPSLASSFMWPHADTIASHVFALGVS